MRVYRSLRRRRKKLGWTRRPPGWEDREKGIRFRPLFPGRRQPPKVTRAEEEEEAVPEAVLLARMRSIKLSKKERAKVKRWVKRALGIGRREVGAIGAGHRDEDVRHRYRLGLAHGYDITRFRRLEEE